MKALAGLSAIFLCICLILGGCSSAARTSGSGGLQVYTGMFAAFEAARKIGGDRATVISLLSDGADAHDFEPTLRQKARLEQADLLMVCGELEGWALKLYDTASSDSLRLVDLTEGLCGDEGDEDSHDHEDENDHAEHDHEGHEHEKHNHDEHEVHEHDVHDHEHDAHVWLDPQLFKIMLRRAADAFIKADPAGHEYFETNYARYAAECDALTGEFTEQTAPLKSRNLVVTHAAFGYMCRAFGLNQVPVSGYSDETEPSARSLAQTIDFIRANGVKTIYFSESGSSRVGDAIARETSIRVSVLSTLERGGEDDYFAVQRKNLAAITAGQGEQK